MSNRPPAWQAGAVRLVAIAFLVLAGALDASAQVDGSASVLFDLLPDISEERDRQTVSELRARLFVERRQDIGAHVRLNLSAYVDGLLGERGAAVRDAIVRPGDLFVEIVSSRADLRAGASRVVWGRLDEIQPTDVVNPVDLSRFLLEGRSEARLPLGLVRGRVFLPGSSTLEAVVVPVFRASRFDQLDEPSSPFNLARVDVPVDRREPDAALANMQGGARFTSTVARFDWGVSAYRGYRSFPTLTVLTEAEGPFVRESFARFTMMGGDFETVRGPWGVRGEVAAFIDDELQATGGARGVEGKSVESGVGLDRRAGDYRVAANVLWSWRAPDEPLVLPGLGEEELERTDFSVVVAADRNFARETRTLRLFAVYDPADETVFARVIAAVSLRDNVWLEGSGGLFAGAAADTIGRLTRRDFVYTRLKVFF